MSSRYEMETGRELSSPRCQPPWHGSTIAILVRHRGILASTTLKSASLADSPAGIPKGSRPLLSWPRCPLPSQPCGSYGSQVDDKADDNPGDMRRNGALGIHRWSITTQYLRTREALAASYSLPASLTICSIPHGLQMKTNIVLDAAMAVRESTAFQ
jgi:hypothetical protein